MPKVEQVGRPAEAAVMTEGRGMWPVQTGLRMTTHKGSVNGRHRTFFISRYHFPVHFFYKFSINQSLFSSLGPLDSA
jgi:hypothetical protein